MYDRAVGNQPKSAFELAMERLREADREAGVEEKALGAEQKARIAGLRTVATSRLAEREILHRDAVKKARSAEDLARLEEEYRTDRSRIEADRDAAIEKVRSGR